MGLGLEGAYGAAGAWDALHKIIAERKKDEIIKQKEEDDRRQYELQLRQQQDSEKWRELQFETLQNERQKAQAERDRSNLEQEATSIKESHAIGDFLMPQESRTLTRTGNQAVQQTPTTEQAASGLGLLGAVPGMTPTLSAMLKTYGGTSQQQHQAQADALADKRYNQTEARQQVLEDQANQRIDISNRLANRPIQIGYVDASGNLVPVGDLAPGGRLSPNPQTAIQRNLQASRKNAGSTIKAINDLSEKINVNQGVLAKVTGYGERAKAQANLNDDVSEYESLVQGFTPLVARAVGHSGVLTEQDVASVRQLFPKVTDSKSLRDRKVARLNAFFAGDEGEAVPPPPAGLPPAAPKAGGMTIDANGKIVPISQ